MTDIKAKIDEMVRIADEIRTELGSTRLTFKWYMDMENAEESTSEFQLKYMLRQFRKELYGDLIKAGVLPEGSRLADSPEPDGR
jgi:hypothetical protein